MISCRYIDIEIKDIKILSSSIERRPGGAATITGTCLVTGDDWLDIDSIPMEFKYTGKADEPSTKLYEYLQVKGYHELEKTRPKQETLIDLIRKNQVRV